MKTLQILPAELTTVRNFLASHEPEGSVYAFGSRVNGNARKASDLDLAIMTRKPLSTRCMADLRDAFTESDLAFKVDFPDWSRLKPDFKEIILKNCIKLQNAKPDHDD